MTKPPLKLPHVKIVKGRYYFRPYIPVKLRGKIETDRYGYAKTILLGKITDPDAKIRKAYADAEQQIEYDKTPDRLTLGWLSEKYQNSRQFKGKEASTQRGYRETGAMILKHVIKINGTETTLSGIDARQLKTTTIRAILDKRFDTHQERGNAGASSCNQELNYLNNLYKYGMQYIPELNTLPRNPTHGIEKFRVGVRDRYVTDEEYWLQYDVACEMTGTPYLPIAMELTYLLAARGVEVTDLSIASLRKLPNGQKEILVERRKGSKDTGIIVSERLQSAWDAALALHTITPIGPSPLLIGKGGHAVTRHALTKAWQKLKQEMKKRNMSDVYFITHDLKRKGISDAEDDKIAGQSAVMRARYSVKHQSFKAPK